MTAADALKEMREDWARVDAGPAAGMLLSVPQPSWEKVGAWADAIEAELAAKDSRIAELEAACGHEWHRAPDLTAKDGYEPYRCSVCGKTREIPII